jgi:hypothetical protein
MNACGGQRNLEDELRPTMSSWKWFLLSFFGGGIAFWVCDLIIPALDRNEKGVLVTILCPIVLILFYVAVLRLRKADPAGPSTAIFAICGMWVLALSFVLLAQEIRAPGSRWAWQEYVYVLVSSFLPWRVELFVTLEGSIIALWLGTTAMLICHLLFERSRWIIPPARWAAVHLE